MNTANEQAPAQLGAPQRGFAPARASDKRRFGGLLVFGVLLCVVFHKPLAELIRFAIAQERNTYLLLVPAISAYLIWIKRDRLHWPLTSSLVPSIFLTAAGIGALAAVGGPAGPVDRLSLQIVGFLAFLGAGSFAFLGAPFLREICFPVAFLIFAVPMPTFLGDKIEVFLQYTSAEAAYWMLSVAQTTMLRDGLDFLLPGISIHVAQECSGYNSTFALFMVSTVAGYMFLKSPWRRTALAIAVIPLAILRNGFRITTIALLCIHVSPDMIDSYIHHNGGPIFFALSLIPFFALLWLMRRKESVRPG
jgi:exosortase C (VPDSG-CTERM-specific)